MQFSEALKIVVFTSSSFYRRREKGRILCRPNLIIFLYVQKPQSSRQNVF